MLLNDLLRQLDESLEKAAGPKFTGYWKAKDAGTPGEKMVGEEANPTDTVTMEIPFLMRVMEFAREDALSDEALHHAVETMLLLAKENRPLTMDDYDSIFPRKEETNEEKKGLYYYVNKRKKAGTSRPKGHPKAPSEQDWKNAAKTAKESVNSKSAIVEKLTAKDSQAKWIEDFKKSNHPKFKGKSAEERERMAKAAYYRTVQNKKFNEEKKKGADGKACWDGYRYAGTEDGKDKCILVKKGK